MSVETAGVLWFAFTAGAATFFAPCSYPLLPGYVAYYVGDAESPDRPALARLSRAAIVGLTASAGFAIVFGVVAAIVHLLGGRALRNAVLLELVVGTVVIVLGALTVVDRVPSVRSLSSIALPERRRSLSGYLLFGVIYAAAAAGCTAPLFVGVAGFALRTGPIEAVAIVGSYVVGMSALLIGLTVLSAIGRDAALRRLSRNVDRIRRLSGVLLMAAGIAQLYLFFFRYGGLGRLGFA